MYTTTKINPIKSYPTYQLHAFTMNNKISSDEAFRICILEVLKWLRSRMERFANIPDALKVPEPENYVDYSDSDILSFSISEGITAEAVYISGGGIWSFRITETDMGANLGTDRERLPVSGRTFSTDVSFTKHKDNVEIGVRTMCSEPSDSTADCEVFRPLFVYSIAQNELVGMKYGYPITTEPIVINTKSDAENLVKMIESNNADIPFIIIAGPGLEPIEPVEKRQLPKIDTKGYDITGFGMGDFLTNKPIEIDMSKVTFGDKKGLKDSGKPGKLNSRELKKISDKLHKDDKPKEVLVNNEEKTERKKREGVDCKFISERLFCYAFVVAVSENCFDILRNKLGCSISSGDIVIYFHGSEYERYSYGDYSKKIKSFSSNLVREMKMFPKHKSISFGEVLFSTDARLADINARKNENLTLEEKLKLSADENMQLKNKVRELTQQHNDFTANSDMLREANRKLKTLDDENNRLKESLEKVNEEFSDKKKAFEDTTEIIEFYKKKSVDAMAFPNNKNDVCEWVKDNFDDTIIIAPRAENELRKYSGSMNVGVLCDGIYFLHGYCRYRRGEISEKQLEFYSEQFHWETTWSGKETLKMLKDDYTATVDGEKYLLEYHIKYGVSNTLLVRIYFVYDEKLRKIIIGYMPGHLPTLKKRT